MKDNLNRKIAETEEKIEKLKILKAKQKELERLETEIVVTASARKEKAVFSLLKKVSPFRKIIVTVMTFILVVASTILFVNPVQAADPAVGFVTPANGGLFADTDSGDGVNWTLNVTDGDSDLEMVRLWSNSSGSWVIYYDSGSLGGVAYHNVSSQNSNWTASWTKYYWNISTRDGTWHNVTYSFNTRYQWGNPQMVVLDDDTVYAHSVVYKNATGEYYLWYDDGTSVDVKISDTGTNWSIKSKSADVATGVYTSGGFTYNNMPHVLYYYSDYQYRSYWNGTAWLSSSTGIAAYEFDTGTHHYSYGADAIYYDGVWNLVCGYHDTVTNTKYLRQYTGSFPSTWAQVKQFDSNTDNAKPWSAGLAILNGSLIITYKDDGDDLHWYTYNGVSWTDKGDIEANIGLGCSVVKDPVNHQLVLVYINGAGNLVYCVTENGTAWSEDYTILAKGGYTIRYPHAEFADGRLTVSFSYNLRGNYNIYTVSAPDYSGRISGLNHTLNRIQFPDSNPDDTNVNSTIFALKNIDNRSIFTIQWHFEDIGDIACASNIKVYTNMSGGWSCIGTCDANGNMSLLDISGEMAGGGEWIVGTITYWKIEILDVGSVPEDIHSTDEDFFYKITFS